MWIGIDDTDSRSGGCTTFVAFTLVQELQKQGFTVVGYPRLVRLNPNVPWKTRGNGAIALQVSKTDKSDLCIGQRKKKDILGCQRENDTDMFKKQEKENLIFIVENIVESLADLDRKNTNPGIVIMNHPPAESWYWRAVREIITIDEIIDYLRSKQAFFKRYNKGRGIIGATAAIAWVPTKKRTFELISYREENQWGTKRNIDEQSVIEMDKQYATLFDSYDYLNDHSCIDPHSPCPVLYGIRGTVPEELLHCQQMIHVEEKKGWMLFESNQGSDDHLQQTTVKKIRAYQSVIVEGTVMTAPQTLKGGHVLFSLKDNENNSIDCAAYEPTKQFRDSIRNLCRGDEIVVYGGVRKKPLTVNIEKILIKNLVKQVEKIENPVCPRCGKHMKSKGKHQGYRCKKCDTVEDQAIIKEKKRMIKVGFYEVPVVARRHLSRPLKLMKPIEKK
ncbi:MAG: tRNA(Ile)(2)-agmatinylcytidine synthase [Thermoplasmatota archaeon]